MFAQCKSKQSVFRPPMKIVRPPMKIVRPPNNIVRSLKLIYFLIRLFAPRKLGHTKLAKFGLLTRNLLDDPGFI